MAKTLLEFREQLLEVNLIHRISKTSKYSYSKGQYMYYIIINEDLPEKYSIRDLWFEFYDSSLRDKKFEELKRKLQEVEHITIL